MICYGDRTWCASPNCKNECGRQLQDWHIKQNAQENMQLPVCYGYYCGAPAEDLKDNDNRGVDSDTLIPSRHKVGAKNSTMGGPVGSHERPRTTRLP